MRLLVAATSQGDLPLPGFASMVHGELGMPPCEIATVHGICASSVRRAAARGAGHRRGRSAERRRLRGERVRQPAAEGVPVPGPGLRRRKAPAVRNRVPPLDALRRRRCAAARATHRRRAASRSKSRRSRINSHAGDFPPCMFVGNQDEVLGEPQVGWLDHPDYEAASAAGAINLHQSTEPAQRRGAALRERRLST